MSFPIRAIVKLRRILLIGLVIAGAFYAVMLMPKMLRLLRKLNQEDTGKEIIFSRIASTLIVPLDTGKHLQHHASLLVNCSLAFPIKVIRDFKIRDATALRRGRK